MKERVSYGIILVKKQPGCVAEFLLVKNRISNEMSELVRKPAVSASSPDVCAALLARTTFIEKQILSSGKGELVAQYMLPVRAKEQSWVPIKREHYEANYQRIARSETFMKSLLSAGHMSIPWVVPRGRLNDSREEPRVAALRELREETGVDLDHVLMDTVFHREFSCVEYGVNYRFHYYLAVTCTDVQPSLSLSSSEQVCELSEMKFMTLEHVKLEAPGMFPMLRAARQYLKNTYPYL